MTQIVKYFCLTLLFGIFCIHLRGQIIPQLGQNTISEVISAMTLDEKTKLVVGTGLRIPGFTDVSKDKVPGEAGSTFAIPRLGIPSMVMADGPAGARINPTRTGDAKTYYATSFPIGTALAATWDTALVRHVGVTFGSEVHEYGIDFILAPAMNIQRNPLGGRNFEYYSEDPVLAGNMATAMIDGIQSNGVGTSLKHFALNNSETNRMQINEIVNQRALREIYLRGFQIAVTQAHPWTVMSSYNKVNGVYASQNPFLLKQVLRNEWGFDGFVMTDWLAGNDPVAQMNVENDLIMPGSASQSSTISTAITNGTLSEDVLDRNVASILKVMLKTPAFKKYNYSDNPDLSGDALISRNAATQGMVLLKNEHKTLPLDNQSASIALFGVNSYRLVQGGTGSGSVNTSYVISLNDGLTNNGFQLNSEVTTLYSNYIDSVVASWPPRSPLEELLLPPPTIPELLPTDDFITDLASTASVAIISIGREFGEGADRQLQNDFLLSDTEHLIIQRVADAFHAQGKKVIVVLNIGGVVEVASWRDQVDGILMAWWPGLEGGNAIAKVLEGDVNPSGKLPMTFPIKYDDVPSASTFPGTDNSVYNEGIYVGYRYYNTNNVATAYEFGYGLSYTTFSYSNPVVSSDVFKDSITVSFTVTNSGSVAGKEVAQLYITAPGKSMDKPSEELKAFGKTKLLQPGESQTFTFRINAMDLASFDSTRQSWIAEPGDYFARAGASSLDIRGSAAFNVPQEIVLGLASTVPIKLLNFDAEKSGSLVKLLWTTASESNSDYFEIEHSTDGRLWNKIGKVKSAAENGSSAQLLNYNYFDENPVPGINYYRLRQADLNGGFTFSNVAKVNFESFGEVVIFPNPVWSTATLSGLQGNELLLITDNNGKLLFRRNVEKHKEVLDFSNLPQGTYRVQVRNPDGSLEATLSVIKAR